MNEDTDRLDWLRKIRQKIVEECGNDPKVMGNYFRRCQKEYEERIIANINGREIGDRPHLFLSR